MPTLDRDGFEIFYEVQGEGPAVLLTHGFSASARMWRRNAPEIAAAGYKVVTWDMRGHGRSASPDDRSKYSVPASVADMEAVLDAAGVGQAVIGGMSLGGCMTLAHHLAHRERATALMLIDTGPGFKNAAAREKWNANARARGDAFLEKGAGALSGSVETRLQSQNFTGLSHAAYGMLTQSGPEMIELLPDIAAPTLVVVGDRDEPFLAASGYMAAKIPNARKAVIADAGHAANVDQPGAFNAVVLDFLGGLAA